MILNSMTSAVEAMTKESGIFNPAQLRSIANGVKELGAAKGLKLGAKGTLEGAHRGELAKRLMRMRYLNRVEGPSAEKAFSNLLGQPVADFKAKMPAKPRPGPAAIEAPKDLINPGAAEALPKKGGPISVAEQGEAAAGPMRNAKGKEIPGASPAEPKSLESPTPDAAAKESLWGQLRNSQAARAGALGAGSLLGGGLIGHHLGYGSGAQDAAPAAWQQGLQAGSAAANRANQEAGFFNRLFGDRGRGAGRQLLAQLSGPQMTQAVVQQILAGL